VRLRRNSRRARALACSFALALAPALDASAQYRSPRHTAAPREGPEGESCRLGTRPLNFGSYEDGSPAAVLTTATIDLACRGIGAASTHAIVTAGPSAVTGVYQDRRLSNGDSRLQYQVYINSQRTIVWGDGTNDTQPVVVVAPNGNSTFTVYGGLFQGQTGEVGRYSDTLLITVMP
jgi:spore coat protein U-like protein